MATHEFVGTLADRPPPSADSINDLYYATDGGTAGSAALFQSNGATWVKLIDFNGIGGGGAVSSVDSRTGAITLTDLYFGKLTPTAWKTGPYTAAVGDFVLIDATSGDVSITLPTAPVDKTIIGAKTVALTGTFLGKVFTGGSDVISVAGGATGRALALNQQVILQYQSSTSIWHILADDVGGTYIDSSDFRPDNAGVNDAAPKINAMLAAGVNRQCVLRKGTYKILSPILLPSYTNLIIEPGTVIQADPAAVTTDPSPGVSAIPAIIQNQNASDSNIRLIAYGVVIDGFKSNGNRIAGNHSRGLFFTSVTGLEVIGIKVQNVEDHGMQLIDCQDFSIRDCTVSAAGKDAANSAGGSGIGVSVGITDLSRGFIGNCYLVNNLRCGIKIGTNPGASANDLYAPVDVVGCKAKGNGIDGASSGFIAAGPVGAGNLFYLRGVNYTNCQAWANNMAGFQLTIGVKNTTLTGCESWNNGTHGFALFQGIQGCSFIGCHALNNSQTTTTTYDGFNIDGSSVVSTDNIFIGCTARDDQTVPTQRWGWFETTTVANARNRVMSSHATGNVTGSVSMTGHPNSAVGGAGVTTLFEDFADVGSTTAASEDTLFTHTLPAALFNTNGDALEWSCQGIFANNARGKRIRVRFAGASGSIVGDTGAMTFAGAATDAWQFTMRAVRVSSGTFRCSCVFTIAGATLVTLQPVYTELTGQTLANTQAIRVTGQIAASGVANDIVAKVGKCVFMRAG